MYNNTTSDVEITAKCDSRNDKTDLLISATCLLPSKILGSALMEFLVEFGKEKNSFVTASFTSAKRVMRITFSPTKGISKHKCYEFQKSGEIKGFHALEKYFEDTNVATFTILRKEETNEFSLKSYSMTKPEVYLKKLCPCVQEVSSTCESIYDFQHSKPCNKF